MLRLMSNLNYLRAVMTYTTKMTSADVRYGADRMRAANPPRMSISRFMPCACDLQSPALEFWTWGVLLALKTLAGRREPLTSIAMNIKMLLMVKSVLRVVSLATFSLSARIARPRYL